MVAASNVAAWVIAAMPLYLCIILVGDRVLQSGLAVAFPSVKQQLCSTSEEASG